MRWISVILLFTGLLVSSASKAQSISYSGKSVSLREVFSAIKEQSGYKFFYRNEDLDGLKPVTIRLNKKSIHEALRLALEGQPLEFSIEGKTVFITRQARAAAAAQEVVVITQSPANQINGTVTDKENNRIPGVTVLAKHSRVMAITSETGEFSIPNLAPGDSLVFSSISFETVTIPARPDVRTLVVLTPKITALTQVTVYNTGYQQVSKERATGSFAQANMNVVQQRAGTNDVLTRLEGLIPGLTVMPNSYTQNPNDVKRKTNNVVIRGIGTVNGNKTPVLVINGMVVPDFSTVNPQDIEEITVLKDAAAAAIYGARASNGVIVVRTKEGKKQQRLEVSYNGNFTYQGKPDLDYDPLMSSGQFIGTVREIFDPSVFPYESVSWAALPPHMKVLYDEQRGLIPSTTANRMLDSMAGISNRQQYRDLFIRNAMNTNHTMSAAGGTENYSIFASLGYSGVQSNTPGEKNNTYKVNVSQSMNFANRVSINLNTSLINNTGSGIGSSGLNRSFLPYQLFRDASGKDINLASMIDLPEALRADYQARSRINLDYFPLQDRELADSKFNDIYINLTGNVNVKLWKGLSYEGLFGYIANPGTSEGYEDNASYTQRMQSMRFTIAPAVNSIPQYLLPRDGGRYNTVNTSMRDWTVRNQLVYTRNPRQGKDAMYVRLGQEGQESFTSRKSLTMLGYDRQTGTYPLLDYATLAQPNFGTVPGFASLGETPYDIREVLSRYSSLFAMAGYTFDGRYTLEGSWRRDRSNLFGGEIGGQNKPTYSVGGKWQLSRERFMENVNWINELGLRASYGITGNAPPAGQAATADILEAQGQARSGSIAGDALKVFQIANRQLTWEATRITNIGVDFGFLKGRLTGSMNYYQRKTQDLLGTLRLSPFSGFYAVLGNVGEMTNKGFELSLQSQNLRIGDFRWQSHLVLSINRNKLLSLGVTSASSYSNTPQGRLFSNFIPGYSMETLWAYQFAGLDAMGDPLVYKADKSTTKAPNSVGVQDMVYAGTTQPVVNGGFRNTFSYKSWELALNMVYSLGHKMRADVPTEFTERIGQRDGLSGQNISRWFLDRWKQPGDELRTNVPSYVADPSVHYSRRHTDYYVYGDVNVLDASYIKLRDVTLSYDVPATALGVLGLRRVNIFAQASNFMIWKANDRDFDPEFIGMRGGGRNIPPFKHSYSAGVNISF